jgi:hypothetical protein
MIESMYWQFRLERSMTPERKKEKLPSLKAYRRDLTLSSQASLESCSITEETPQVLPGKDAILPPGHDRRCKQRQSRPAVLNKIQEGEINDNEYHTTDNTPQKICRRQEVAETHENAHEASN